MSEVTGSLSALLEESTSSAVIAEETEFIPTLASLLLSTAQSLQSRTQLNGKKASFQLTTPPQQLLSEPSSLNYLSSLLTLSLSSLQSLPSSLTALSTSLDTELSTLAFNKYSSFLLSHTATTSISTSFSTISTSLSSLLSATDELESSCAAFSSSINSIKEKRSKIQKVVERIGEVEELLEIPSLVDSCVRVGYWSEAITIAGILNGLFLRMKNSSTTLNGLAEGEENESGGGAIELLANLTEQVAKALISLRARVLESFLQRNLKLPGAVRGIGILRRMNEGGLGLEREEEGIMEEEILRIIFLKARWKCLRGELEGVEGQMIAAGIILDGGKRVGSVGVEESESCSRWVKKWIEVWREVVGETVGMYEELFLSKTIAAKTEEGSLPALSPLTLFLSIALKSLSTTILASLESITSHSSLNSLLTQLAYCSHSFARNGLEFREIETIREKMEERVIVIISTELELAGKKWEKELREGYESTGTKSRNKNKKDFKISDWLVVPEGMSTILSTPLPDQTPTSWHHQPPSALALLPPLAKLLNSHAAAFNSLRLFPARAVFQRIRYLQGKELDRASRVLEAFIEGWRSEKEILESKLNGNLENGDLNKEELEKIKEAERERGLMIFLVGAFGKWFLPWCGNLSQSVFEEIAGEKELEPLVIGAIKKVERLWRKMEGKEEVEELVTKELKVVEVISVEPTPILEMTETEVIAELEVEEESDIPSSRLNGLAATIELDERESVEESKDDVEVEESEVETKKELVTEVIESVL